MDGFQSKRRSSRPFGMRAMVLWMYSLLMASTCESFTPLPFKGRHETRQLVLQSTNTISDTSISDAEASKESPLLTSWFPNDRQILRFQEPKTNVTVMLVGSMHYNPASIKLVETTVESLAKSNQLASVIIESCDIRWNKTQELLEQKAASSEGVLANDKDFLGNEMRAAWEVASKFQRPTVLGDQRINITTDALKSSLKETASDLFLGGPEGWKRSRDEIAENWAKTIPISTSSDREEYLNAIAFFDPRLLICLPISLVKYPLSFFVKDPVPFGTFFLLFAGLNLYGSGVENLPSDWTDLSGWMEAMSSQESLVREYPWTDYLLSLGIALLETVIFGRLLLKPLLADRNEILAKSVLDQCFLYASSSKDFLGPGWFRQFFPSTNGFYNEDIIYVPGSDPKTLEATKTTDLSDEKVVVAVLGMAHCNGVMKLLKEQKV